MAKPKIAKGVASNYANRDEVICDVTVAGGPGALLSARHTDDGRLIITVYRCDDGVEVVWEKETGGL
jgi:hypothetical protein